VELGPLARASGIRLLAFDEIDSTNEEAKRLVAEGERGPLWIIASRQTKGRGRRGREWVSAPGNLHASLVLTGCWPPAIAPRLGFVAGVAAIAALREATGAPERFALKWPNDLLLDGAKLGGILLEGVTLPTVDARAPNESAAVIGIGVNCAFAPADLPHEARALGALGEGAPSAAALFAHLTDAVVATLDLWNNGEGFAQVRERWLARAAGLGQTIRVALARETIEGRFETLDETGRLILATHAGARAIDAGDVHLARAGATQLEPTGTRP
jgi:BirA family biotin operon repressor/biotin-[acetyl-CoA-carboxylase] ligase